MTAMNLPEPKRERLAQMRDACQAALDGRPWEAQNPVGEWRKPEEGTIPLNYYKARPAPWHLPPAPEGKAWHRDDWEEHMLPPVTDGGLPWRPLLLGEARHRDDQVYGEFSTGPWAEFGNVNYTIDAICTASSIHTRTRRLIVSLPSAPVVRPWASAEDVPGPGPCYIRSIHSDGLSWSMITSAGTGQIIATGDAGIHRIEYSELKYYQHSTDRKTWHPCATEPQGRAGQ
jgi:hypothetical protein